MEFKDKAIDFWLEEARAGRIYWHGELTGELAFLIASQLDTCERNKSIETITLDISTCGGEVPGMWQIVDRIRSMETPVTTVCSGMALSAGFIALAAGRKRRALRHSYLLFHGALHWQGWAKSPEATDEAAHAKALDDMLCEFMGEVTKRPQSHWRKLVAGVKDRYVTVQEALEWGIIDEIVSAGKAPKGK